MEIVFCPECCSTHILSFKLYQNENGRVYRARQDVDWGTWRYYTPHKRDSTPCPTPYDSDLLKCHLCKTWFDNPLGIYAVAV